MQKNNRVAQICRIAIMAALFFLLAKLTVRINNVRILDFASLPIAITAILYGPWEAAAAAFVGEFVSQLLGYGLTATTLLWILPPIVRALVLSIFIKCSKKNIETRVVYTYVAFIVAALATTLSNTAVTYIDAKIYGYYTYAYVFGSFFVRLGTGALTAVVVASVSIPICRALRKYTGKNKETGGDKMKNYSFKKAKAVWEEGTERAMNRWLIFRAELAGKKKATLSFTGSASYVVKVNGNFAAFGPARSAHGFYRVDEIDLSPYLSGETDIVTITVAGSNICSFYHIDEPSFLTAEIISGGRVLAATGADGFVCKHYTEHEERVHRYSYQRTFCEVYNLNEDYNKFFVSSDVSGEELCRVAPTGEKKYISRGCGYTDYPVREATEICRRGRFSFGSHGHEMNFDRSITLPRKEYSSGKVYGGYKLSELTTNTSMYTRNLDTSEIFDVSEDARRFVVPSGEFAIASFEVNTTGAFELSVFCKRDATLVLTFDETLTDGDINYRRLGSCNSIIYRLKAGNYKISTYEPYTCKYVKIYAVGGDIDVEYIRQRFFGANMPERKFEGDDEELREIYNAAVETYRQNTFTAFLDCPTRERAGWLCDSFFTARAEKVLTGKSEVERNFLENFLLPERFEALDEGILPMCYPADHYNGSFIPNWDMFYVLELEEYVLRTKDNDFAELAKPKIYKMMKYFEKFENEYGLLEKLDGWIFVDWSKSNELTRDVNFPTNMLYSATLSCVGRLYGDGGAVQKARKVADAVNSLSYVGPFYCDNAVRRDGKLELSGQFTESCQNYAFFCGIATPDSRRELFDILMNDFGPDREKTGKWSEVAPANAFIGNYIRLEMMSRFGENEKLLENIRGYFLDMARKTGTLWEMTNTRGSLCHGFASHVVYWLDKMGYVK